MPVFQQNRRMEFFCYHRDRPGSMALRTEMVEDHWAYMDRFDAAMIARGPTFADDETLTGSLHVVDLPGPDAARAFAFEEPGWQAGAYQDVLLRRWSNALGRTMWDHSADLHGRGFLVLGFTPQPIRRSDLQVPDGDLIAFGPLLSDDGAFMLGAAALLVAPDATTAGATLAALGLTGVEAHRWRFGGRP